MKQQIFFISFALLLVFAASVFAGDGEGVATNSFWLGGHYTDFKDYTAKVGEYKLQSDKFLPEFKFNYFSQEGASVFRFNGHYFDYENMKGLVKTTTGDKFKAEFQYRSMTNNKGMDLLENMAAREWLGDHPGGKMITHEFLDDITEFPTHRQEFSGKAELLLSRKNDVRFVAAHRFIKESGNDQVVGNNHCFSCHLGSQSVDVDKRTNSLKLGLEGKALEQKLAYAFGYRKFENRGPDANFFYDQARHPVNGGSAVEFGPREIYNNGSYPIAGTPETEKLSHKFTSKGKLGSAHYAAALTYSRAENKAINFTDTKLVSEAIGGKLNITAPLSPKSRLVAKLGVNSIKNEDPFIDVPDFRAGRWPDSANGEAVVPPNFDYTRYSSLDRTTIDGSAEYITRVNKQLTVGILAGLKSVSRKDYPDIAGDNTSTTMIGQLNLKYRQGLKMTTRLKYRLETTSDPYTSGRGLFERIGADELVPLNGTTFIFYHQREDLRYQAITTEPTMKHKLDFSTSYRFNSKVNLLVGLKAMMDKNGDLDSLDVKHSSFTPNLNLTLMPTPEWVIVTGVTYNQSKSRGPVTIALFDG